MLLHNIFSKCDTSVAVQKSRLLPFTTHQNSYPLNCLNCNFINRTENHFCTNCGYPVHPNADRVAIYNLRLQKRKNQQKTCLIKVEHARNAIYVIAAVSMLGVFYAFTNYRQTTMTGFVMLLLSIIYAALGRWSLQRPFTALLISFIILLTFAAINTWAEITSMFTTAGGVYMLTVQIILIYILLQGVKGAFHADILEEQFKY